MKSIIFWDMTPCSLLSCNRSFGGTFRLHLQGRRNNFSKNEQANRWQVLATTRRHMPEDDTLSKVDPDFIKHQAMKMNRDVELFTGFLTSALDKGER
jgi:hypothetical protein